MCRSRQLLLSGTLQIVLNACLLFYYIGISSVVGILMLFSLIPINRVLVGMQVRHQRDDDMQPCADQPACHLFDSSVPVGMQMKLRFATQKHVDERVKVAIPLQLQ